MLTIQRREVMDWSSGWLVDDSHGEGGWMGNGRGGVSVPVAL